MAGRLITICQVVPYPPNSGGRKRTLRLLETAEDAGLRPHLLVVDRAEPAAEEALRERGWTVEALAAPRGGPGARLRQHVGRLPSPFNPEVPARLRQLLAEGPSPVQVEHVQSAYYGSALQDVPWIFSLHNVDSELARTVARTRRPGSLAWLRDWSRWEATRRVERRAAPGASAVLCVSEGDAAVLSQLNRRVVVAANGVDDEFFAIPAEPPAAPRVVFFGQLDYPPNCEGIARFLEEGWPHVHSARPDAVLRVVGANPPAKVRRAVAAAPTAELVGFVPDLAAELGMARLTVVPIWAGGGTRLKVLESLAAARPVVGTPLGVEGLGFEPGRHGFEADSPAELAAAVAELLGDPARGGALGRQGREHAEAYRWPRALAPAGAIYAELSALFNG